MARRKGTASKYTKAQKLKVLKRIQAGETQVAVAASSGVPLATVGYWTRKAKGSSPASNGANRTTKKRGRPAGSRNRAVTRTSASTGADRKSTRLNSSHNGQSRMPSSA